MLRAKVAAGEKLLLIYNFDAYPENTTDMAGVLERLYISLGHQKFVESIFVFGDTTCRYACLPIQRIDDLPRFSLPLPSGDPALPERIQGYYTLLSMPGAWGWKRFTVESARVFATLRQRFHVELDAPRGTYYAPFTITPTPQASPSAVVDVDGALYHGHAGTLPFEGVGFPLDVLWFDGEAGLFGAETIPPHLWARPGDPHPSRCARRGRSMCSSAGTTAGLWPPTTMHAFDWMARSRSRTAQGSTIAWPSAP
jgi:hypothetical protein